MRVERLAFVRQYFSIFSRRTKRVATFYAIVQSSLGFLDLVGVGLLGAVTALALTGSQSKQPGNRVSIALKILGLSHTKLAEQVLILSSIACLVLIAKTFISMFASKKILTFVSHTTAEIASDVIMKVFRAPSKAQSQYSESELIYFTSEGLENITIGILGTALTMVADFSLLIVLGIGVFVIDPFTAFTIFTLFGLALLAIQRVTNSTAREVGNELINNSIKSSTLQLELIRGFKQLYVSGRQLLPIAELIRLRRINARLASKRAYLPNVSKYVLEATIVIGAVVVTAIQFAANQPTRAVGSLAIFLASGARIAPALMRLQQGATLLRINIGGASKALDFEKRFSLNSIVTSISRPEGAFTPSIHIRDVEFKYAEDSTFQLGPINMDINAGSLVALVGPSGGGKSTLVDLILGLRIPTRGKIELSGLKPSDCYANWPGDIAYVPQNSYFSEGTIRENLLIGLDANRNWEQKIREVLSSANLFEAINFLPDGLETVIGSKGIQLSVGQIQRLNIARALLTSPKILVMDESTSSLDAESERLISESVNKLRGKTTVLLIAHRLSSIRAADQIYYIDQGKLIASGNFLDLRTKLPDFDKQAQILGI